MNKVAAASSALVLFAALALADELPGDTYETAIVIDTLPFVDSGSTAEYTNNFTGEVCPYGTNANDVFYVYTPPHDQILTIDTLGTGYDNALFVADVGLNVVACNMTYYPSEFSWAARISYLPVLAGETYYIVVDGVSSASGTFALSVHEFGSLMPDCPPEAQVEDEPWNPGGLDDLNGGCSSFNALGYAPMMDVISPVLCATSGRWNAPSSGSDADYFVFEMPPVGTLEVSVQAEGALRIYQIVGGDDCNSYQPATVIARTYPGSESSVTIAGEPGQAVILIVVAMPAEQAGFAFPYQIRTNLSEPVRVDRPSLTTVKGLFKEPFQNP